MFRKSLTWLLTTVFLYACSVTPSATTTPAALTIPATPEAQPTAVSTPTEAPTPAPTATEAAPKDGDIKNGSVYKEFQVGNGVEISGYFVLHGKFPLVEYNDDPTYLKDSVYKEIYYMDGLGGPDFSHPENSKGTLSGALLSMMYKQLSGSMTRVDVYDQALAGILHIPFTDAQGVERVYITGSGDKTYVVPWSATEGIDAFKQWDDPYGMQYRSIVTTDQNNALVTIIATEFPDDLSEEQQRIFSLFGIASILSDPTQKEIGFTQKLSTLVATSGEPVNPHIMVSP